MRALLAALALAWSPAALADARTTVASEALLTRYGTAHETVNVLTLESGMRFRPSPRLTLAGSLPLASSFTQRNSCCGYSLGNVTGAVAWALEEEGPRLDLVASASLPTATPSGSQGANARYAATAAVTRDAGLYLPGTGTVRLGLVGRAPLAPGLWIGAAAGAHAWIASAAHGHRILIPLEASAEYALSSRISASAALHTIASPASRGEAFLHAASLGVGQSGPVALTARVHLPLDDSLRSLGMIGFGAAIAAAL